MNVSEIKMLSLEKEIKPLEKKIPPDQIDKEDLIFRALKLLLSTLMRGEDQCPASRLGA